MDFSAAFCGAKTAAGTPLRSGSCYVKYDIGLWGHFRSPACPRSEYQKNSFSWLWAICSLLISRNIAKNNKKLCRPSFTESQQSLFRSQYRIGCDSKPANHSLAKIRTSKMALVSAIILLSSGKWDFQKVSVFKAFQPLMFTFFLFPLKSWALI